MDQAKIVKDDLPFLLYDFPDGTLSDFTGVEAMNPVVQDHVVKIVHELHPQVGAMLTPDQWFKLIQTIQTIVATILPLLNPTQIPSK